MFLHSHPYEPFLYEGAKKMIVGTLPPPRFTTGELAPEDVDFCYGSKNGMLWPILDAIFDLGLEFATTHTAIKQRKHFLLKHKIGVCDIVESAERQKVDASDLGMKNVKLRDMLYWIENYPSIRTLLFMGGNSKNGPEYFFRRQLREHKVVLEPLVKDVPRINQFRHPSTKKIIQTVTLTAPSGTANIAVGSNPLYKKMKAENPKFNTFDFRVMQYRPFFEN